MPIIDATHLRTLQRELSTALRDFQKIRRTS